MLIVICESFEKSFEWGMTKRYIDLLTRHKVKLLCIRDRLLFDENGAAPILTIKNAECPL